MLDVVVTVVVVSAPAVGQVRGRRPGRRGRRHNRRNCSGSHQ